MMKIQSTVMDVAIQDYATIVTLLQFLYKNKADHNF